MIYMIFIIEYARTPITFSVLFFIQLFYVFFCVRTFCTSFSSPSFMLLYSTIKFSFTGFVISSRPCQYFISVFPVLRYCIRCYFISVLRLVYFSCFFDFFFIFSSMYFRAISTPELKPISRGFQGIKSIVWKFIFTHFTNFHVCPFLLCFNYNI